MKIPPVQGYMTPDDPGFLSIHVGAHIAPAFLSSSPPPSIYSINYLPPVMDDKNREQVEFVEGQGSTSGKEATALSDHELEAAAGLKNERIPYVTSSSSCIPQ